MKLNIFLFLFFHSYSTIGGILDKTLKSQQEEINKIINECKQELKDVTDSEVTATTIYKKFNANYREAQPEIFFLNTMMLIFSKGRFLKTQAMQPYIQGG